MELKCHSNIWHFHDIYQTYPESMDCCSAFHDFRQSDVFATHCELSWLSQNANSTRSGGCTNCQEDPASKMLGRGYGHSSRGFLAKAASLELPGVGQLICYHMLSHDLCFLWKVLLHSVCIWRWRMNENGPSIDWSPIKTFLNCWFPTANCSITRAVYAVWVMHSILESFVTWCRHRSADLQVR